MKYLIINGSPHKQNTWKVVENAITRIKEQDTNSMFEEIHLIKEEIPFCIGCSNCFRKGGEFCPHNGIMSQILKKMEQADAFIIASTTFNLRETALLKNMLDHLNYLLHRPCFFKKKALIITTVGGVGGKSTVESIASTLRGMGVNRCYGICIQSISWNAFELKKKHIHQIKKITYRFCKDTMSRKVHYPKTILLIPYNLFRGMAANYKKGSEFETQDGIYYLEEDRKNRAYDKAVPLMLYQKCFGAIFYTIGKIAGKKMIVTYRK